jgi:NADH-quinone oxidoreductase subunit C
MTVAPSAATAPASKLGPQAIFELLQARHGDLVSDFTTTGTKDPYCKVKPPEWATVARTLKTDPALRFDFLQCVSAVDWIKQSIIQVVYHLYSYPHRHSFVVKADLPRDNPTIPSVAALWVTADWQEREQYDLLGVLFDGHPELKRILMPDDWVGHPMRKDYKEAPRYREMPTTRPATMDLLKIYDQAVLKGEVKS